MSRRSVGQLSLADGLVEGGGSRALDPLASAVDWGRFEPLLAGIHASERGRPGYPPLQLFKCLLLQQWYRLSDPGLEEALSDRLSFRRFVGLSLSERVPDHSTLSRFRTRLGEDGVEGSLAEALFDELAAQLSAAGLILREGTLIDATVVQADAVPYGHERAAERSDQDAGFTMTRRGYRLGYKAHVALDKGSRLIRRAVLTPANRHDLDPVLGPGSRLVQGDEAQVYADTAYDSRAMRAHLAERGIGDGVLRRSFRGRPLTPECEAANARHARERVAIESLFGLMKRHYGYLRVRYRTLARNATQLQLLCMAINLRRALVLKA